VIYWKLEEKKLDLAYTWKISRNESTYKINFFISAKEGHLDGIGETAPNVRYGENPERIKLEFEQFLNEKPEKIDSLDQLTAVLKKLNVCNSLRFGIESAFIHYLCKKKNISIYQLLKVPVPSTVATSYTIPIMDPSSVKEFIDKYNLRRFKSLKIKINTDSMDLINECIKHYPGSLRIDANEAWTNVEEVIPFIEKLKTKNVEFVEQPLPYHMIEEYIHLKKHTVLPLIGDESIINEADFSLLQKQFHGVNVKLMKAGGYLNGRDLLLQARKHGMKTMIGCMVETSLGIASGIHLCGLVDYADLDGHFVLAKDPFDLVKEEDGLLSLK
jgi:L-alanine-DL-glutamate epimerase-like enolase superfamily enzyme